MSYLSDILRDPVKECEIYKNEGCSHVDGPLCDFPECKMLKDITKPKQEAFVIIEHSGRYEDKITHIYGVTLDEVKAEILKTESIESHKKIPDSELPMTWETFGELQQLYENKLEECNWVDEKVVESGFHFESYSLDDFYFMNELYEKYFYDDYVCTTIVKTSLY